MLKIRPPVRIGWAKRKKTIRLIILFQGKSLKEEYLNAGFLNMMSILAIITALQMDSIKSVLKTTHGIFAVTPSGAKALYERRFEINLSILLLKPVNDSVIRRNLEIRGIINIVEQNKLIEAGKQFHLPPEVRHTVIEITGDIRKDEDSLKSVLHGATLLPPITR